MLGLAAKPGGSLTIRWTPIICSVLLHITLAYAAGPLGNGAFAGGHRGDADGGGDEKRDDRARDGRLAGPAGISCRRALTRRA